MGGGASQATQARQEVPIDQGLAKAVCKHLDSQRGEDEHADMQKVVQGCMFSTMYCLVKKAGQKGGKHVPELLDKAKDIDTEEVMEVAQNGLQELGWQTDCESEPEAVSELFQEFGGLALGLAGTALTAAGFFPATLLAGIACKWLKKSKKPALDITKEMRKCLDEQAAKELTGALNSALSVLSEVQDTPALKGKISKADTGAEELRKVIELFFTQLESACHQQKGFEEGQAEMFNRLQFAICLRLLALKLQKELGSDNRLDSFEKVRISYEEKLKGLWKPYALYRNELLNANGEVHSWIFWQDNLTMSYVYADVKEQIIVIGDHLSFEQGSLLELKQAIRNALQAGRAGIISQNDPRACALVCQEEMRNEYLQYLKEKHLKVAMAPTNKLLWDA